MNNIINSKRLKSFFITASSLLGTALLAIVLTPEFSNFLQLARETLASWGIPTVIIALIGVFISELWKAILNARTIAKQSEVAGDSFRDYKNELY